jgi:hypothetical protein
MRQPWQCQKNKEIKETNKQGDKKTLKFNTEGFAVCTGGISDRRRCTQH